MKMETKLKFLVSGVVICLLMAICPSVTAEELANNAKDMPNMTVYESDEIEWQVVWQDEIGTAEIVYGEPELVPIIIKIAYAAWTVYSVCESLKQGDYASAIAELVPIGKTITIGKKGADIIKSFVNDGMQIGRKTEAAVLEALRKTKNTERKCVHLDGRRVCTIPDYIDHDKKEVGEIKDYRKVNKSSFTRQIRAQIEWAKQNGYRYKLYVNDCNKITGPLRRTLDELKKADEESGCFEISKILKK